MDIGTFYNMHGSHKCAHGYNLGGMQAGKNVHGTVFGVSGQA